MTRSVLTIVQDAATKLGIAQPSVLFGSTDRTAIELREALNEAVDKILHAHDWQRLLTLQTYIGDGATTQFSIPADYLRMPKSAEVWSSRLQAPLAHISPEDWLQLDTRDYDVATGVWTIFGGEFVYKPAPASGETTRFWYITNKVCTNDTSGTKAQFTEDDDTFLLDDRVLELVLVWLFRTQKGLDYAEDMATAEIALARMIERDKGARIITQRSRRSVGAKIAWPGVLSP